MRNSDFNSPASPFGGHKLWRSAQYVAAQSQSTVQHALDAVKRATCARSARADRARQNEATKPGPLILGPNNNFRFFFPIKFTSVKIARKTEEQNMHLPGSFFPLLHPNLPL
jgi:hypothetical protein